MPKNHTPAVKELSVHRNTIERKHRRDMATAAKADLKAIMEHDVRAYAIVAINSEGDAMAAWDTGAIMPIWAFPVTVSQILDADIRNADVEDEWKPSLAERKRPKNLDRAG